VILIPVQDCKDKGQDGKSWGPNGKCYLHDGSEEGIKKAIEKAVAQGLAEGGGKLANTQGELTLEYLKSFYDAVMSHPGIWNQIKDDIHVQARGSAGGKLKGTKQDLFDGAVMIKGQNAAFLDGDILETPEYFDVPTVFAKEGVFTGTNGIPTLKKYDVLKVNAPRFLGVPITEKHLETDTLRPDDRWLGHAISATPRDDKRDIFGISRYYKKDLLPDEIGKIQNRQFPDASPGYFTITKSETGEFGGKHYDAVEEGPYNVVEYANFFSGTKGACSREMGCGPFQNSAEIDELISSPPSLKLEDGVVKKRCPKLKNEADQMAEDEIKTKLEQTEKLLNSANEKVASLETEMEKLKNAALEVETLKASVKALGDEFKVKNAAEVKAREDANKGEFKKLLNAAATTEVDTLWDQVKVLGPMDFEQWKITNSSKLLTEAEKRTPAGKKQMDAAGDLREAAHSALAKVGA
jgi:hypothetical protein